MGCCITPVTKIGEPNSVKNVNFDSEDETKIGLTRASDLAVQVVTEWTNCLHEFRDGLHFTLFTRNFENMNDAYVRIIATVKEPTQKQTIEKII